MNNSSLYLHRTNVQNNGIVKTNENQLNIVTMAHLNGKGPDEKGPKTGRGIGQCASSTDAKNKLGIGMGLRRQSGGGEGRGKRLKSGLK